MDQSIKNKRNLQSQETTKCQCKTISSSNYCLKPSKVTMIVHSRKREMSKEWNTKVCVKIVKSQQRQNVIQLEKTRDKGKCVAVVNKWWQYNKRTS